MVERPRTLAAARALIAALDRNDADDVAARFAPGAVWWVDSGRDRAAGRFGYDPGDARAWPLHGGMDAHAKSAMLKGLPKVFPGGLRQIERRAFAGGDAAVVEAEGDGVHRSGRPYRNRYAFVVTVGEAGVTDLREYIDTAHAVDVFGGANLERRGEAAPLAAPRPQASTAAGRVALAFIDAISAADPGGLRALCTDDATWWADGGKNRTSGPEAESVAVPGRLFMGRVPVVERAALVGGLARKFPDGLVLSPHRLIEGDGVGEDGLVAVETEGLGRHVSGRLYQNRYCWVLEVRGGRVAEIREYCDTFHGFDIFYPELIAADR